MLRWKKPVNDLDVDVRFLLANERTMLAWIRTALALIAGGVAVAFIAREASYGAIAGIGAVAFGGLLAIIGYIRYHVADAAIRSGKLPATGIAGLFVMLGVVLFSVVLITARGLNVL